MWYSYCSASGMVEAVSWAAPYVEYSGRPLWIFSCSCTEKESHNKCEKFEKFGSVTGVVVRC